MSGPISDGLWNSHVTPDNCAGRYPGRCARTVQNVCRDGRPDQRPLTNSFFLTLNTSAFTIITATPSEPGGVDACPTVARDRGSEGARKLACLVRASARRKVDRHPDLAALLVPTLAAHLNELRAIRGHHHVRVHPTPGPSNARSWWPSPTRGPRTHDAIAATMPIGVVANFSRSRGGICDGFSITDE